MGWDDVTLIISLRTGTGGTFFFRFSSTFTK